MGKSRKFIIFVCMTVLSLFCMLSATACGNILQTECATEHNLKTKEKVLATCLEDGYEIIECTKCSYERKDVLPKHIQSDWDYETVKRVDATCTEVGNEEYRKCKKCGTIEDGKTIADFRIPKKGHDTDFTNTASKKANCQEQAYCGDCKESYGVKLTDHTYEREYHEKIEPTCTTVGYSDYETCAKCTYNSGRKQIAALGHDGYRDSQLTSTINNIEFLMVDSYIDICTKEAWCGFCREEYIPSCNHEAFKNFKGETAAGDSKPATCTEQAYCGRCENLYGDPLGHDIKIVEAKETTCTTNGYKEYEKCQRTGCDYNTKVEIAAYGHDYVDIDVKATCVEYGYKKEHICYRCERKELKAAIEHKKENEADWNKHNQNTCEDCKNIYKKYYSYIIDPIGHDVNCTLEFSEKWTCLKKGFCGRCKEYYGEIIGKHKGGEATCEKGAICEVCGEEYTYPNGHSYLNGACITCKKKQPTD